LFNPDINRFGVTPTFEGHPDGDTRGYTSFVKNYFVKRHKHYHASIASRSSLMFIALYKTMFYWLTYFKLSYLFLS